MIKRLMEKYKRMSPNDKIVLRHTAGAFLVKGLSLCVSLFTIPAYLRFFHDEMALGLWFTVLSVLNWILNFDLGIGNGLRNHLTTALAEGRREDARRHISSAYLSVGGLVMVMSAIFLFAFSFVNWNAVFNIETQIVSSDALYLSVAIVFFGIMLQFFFKLISSVLYAMQKSSVNNFLNLATSVLTILCVTIIPSGSNDRNMIVMAVVHALAVLLPLLAATVVVFAQKRMRDIRPSLRFFSKTHAKGILSLGSVFLLVQVFYMLIMSTNDYLITALCSPDAVVDYQIYYKLFSLGGTVFALALTPIWSAVTKAFAEKDYAWIRSLYKKLCLLATLATACEFLIVPFLQLGVNLWLGDEAIQTSMVFGAVFAAQCSLMCWNSVLSSITNGLGKLKMQLIGFGVGAVFKIVLSWLFVQMTHSWIGVPLANVVALGIYCTAEPLYIRKLLKDKG